MYERTFYHVCVTFYDYYYYKILCLRWKYSFFIKMTEDSYYHHRNVVKAHFFVSLNKINFCCIIVTCQEMILNEKWMICPGWPTIFFHENVVIYEILVHRLLNLVRDEWLDVVVVSLWHYIRYLLENIVTILFVFKTRDNYKILKLFYRDQSP